MLLTTPERYTEAERFVKVFIHECERTYGDRLISLDNLRVYRENMLEIVNKSFAKFNFKRFFGPTPENLLYCNFPSGI